MVSLRPFHPADSEPTTTLLQALWEHTPAMLAQYRVHRDWSTQAKLLRLTLVATVDEHVVGVGTLFESTLHPAMLMVTVNVAVQWQRQGIGTFLFQALNQYSDHRRWFVKLTRCDPAGIAFFTKLGFHSAVTTMIGLLDPQEAKVRAWMATLPAFVPDCQILCVDPTATAVSRADVALVHAAIYRQFHRWNPPVAETVEQALAHYSGPTVIPGSQFCVYANERLVGAANLIVNPFQPSTNEAYLVNIGILESIQPDAHMLTAALLRRVLTFAAEQNLSIRFEVDSTYIPLYSLLDAAPATNVDQDFVIMVSWEAAKEG